MNFKIIFGSDLFPNKSRIKDKLEEEIKETEVDYEIMMRSNLKLIDY